MVSNLKEKIENIISTNKATADAYGKQIILVLDGHRETANRFTPEGLRTELDELTDPIMESWARFDKASNDKFHSVLDDVEKEFNEKCSGETVPDAPIKMSNALQLIQILHPETDEQAYSILKEFVDAKDYAHLKIFRQVLGQNIELENTEGRTNFPCTFGDLCEHEAVNNMFRDLHELGSGIFLHQKQIGSEGSLTADGKQFGVPQCGYSQEVDEIQAVSYAKYIDSLLSSM